MYYNQQCRREYENKLRAALKELGFTEHNFSIPNAASNHMTEHICYDCLWCGCLISGLDTHIARCAVMSDDQQRVVARDVERAQGIILDRLAKIKDELASDELDHLYKCGWGPHVDRIELMQLCEEAKICAYAYDLAERQLTTAKQIGNFMVPAHPEHDLQIMLPPQPEPAEV